MVDLERIRRWEQDVVAEPQAQLEQKHLIEVLVEENTALNNNKILLLATIKQITEEFRVAQELWSAEKESLLGDQSRTE